MTAETRVVEVDGCWECPFSEQYPDRGKDSFTRFCVHEDNEDHVVDPVINLDTPPEWCPLRRQAQVVVLSEKALGVSP